MLLNSLELTRDVFEAGTGWALKPEGACRGDVCIPLKEPLSDTVDVASIAQQMGLPLIHDEAGGVWSLGPWGGSGRTLAGAEAPEFVLPQLNGTEFRLSSLRGTKVLLVAWAPY